jgi:AcrR family transcriptional regulator
MKSTRPWWRAIFWRDIRTRRYAERTSLTTPVELKNMAHLAMLKACGEIFAENQAGIRIKNRERAVRNLSKIFDAALSISNRKGFHAMSLRDLSEGSGLSMGALYSYFKSKDELLKMILDQGRRVALLILSERIAEAPGPREKLAAAISAHLYLSEAMGPWFYFSYMEAKNLPKKMQKEAIMAELATEQALSRIIEDGQKQGVFAAADPDLSAAILKAMLQDWYLKRWKYKHRKIPVETYAGFVIRWAEALLCKT